MTTTIARESTTVPSVSSSTLTAKNADRSKIVATLFALRNAALKSGDASNLENYLVPRGGAFDADSDVFKELNDKGLHYAGDAVRLHGIYVVEDKGVMFRADVILSSKEVDILNSKGKVVRTEPASREADFGYTLVFVDNHWRILSFTQLNLSPEMRDKVLKAGVPT